MANAYSVKSLNGRLADIDGNILFTGGVETGFTGKVYAIWTGSGLTYDIFFPDYYINGILYIGGKDRLTLSAADPTNPRLDTIAVDSTGALIITGLAVVNPIVPTIDPETQLEITTILVGSGATTPVVDTFEQVYNENTEWTTTSTGSLVNFSAVNNPIKGIVNATIGATPVRYSLYFNNGLLKNIIDFTIFKFDIYFKSNYGKNSTIEVNLLKAGTVVATTNISSSKDYFSPVTFNQYQTVITDISSFTATDTQFDTIEIKLLYNTSLGFDLDNVALVEAASSITPSPAQSTFTSIVTNNGIVNAEAPNETISILGTGSVQVSSIGKVINIEGPTNTSELLNNGSDGLNPFATVESVANKSLQDVINVNKVADRVDFRKTYYSQGEFVPSNGYFVDFENGLNGFYLYGNFTSYDGVVADSIIKLNFDGTISNSFTPVLTMNNGVFGSYSLLEEIGTEKLIISGGLTTINGVLINRIARLNSDGSVDAGFNVGTGFNDYTTGLAYNIDNTKLYIGGNFTQFNGTSKNRIVRLNLDGTVDDSFNVGAGFTGGVLAILPANDGGVFVTSYSPTYKGISSNGIVKLLPNGDIDTSFNVGTGISPTANFKYHLITKAHDSKLYVYSYDMVSYNGTAVGKIVKLNLDGTIDTSFVTGVGFSGNTLENPVGTGRIVKISVDTNNRLLVVGSFTTYKGVSIYNGTAIDGTIVLNTDGSVHAVPKTSNDSSIGQKMNFLEQLTNGKYLGFIDGKFTLLNDDFGASRNFTALTFSETTGKAEYLVGGLAETTQNEVLPRRLIQELITNGGITIGSSINSIQKLSSSTSLIDSNISDNGTLVTIGNSIRATNYGTGTKTGTASYGLSVDINGNIIETALGGTTPTLQQVVTQGNSIFTQIGTNGVNLQVNEAGTVGLNITSTLGGIGIKSSSTGGSSGAEFTNSGVNSGIDVINTSSGNGILMINPGTGTALRISGTSAAKLFSGNNNFSETSYITKEGRIQGTSFVKTGGLSTQSLMADGTTTIIAVSTASNGLTKTVNNIKLGGVMTDSTTNIGAPGILSFNFAYGTNIGIINLPATKEGTTITTAMPLWDSTGITSTGVKTYFDIKSEHYGSGAGEANQATTQMDNYAFSSATETDAHFAVIADRNGALDNSKSYVLTETKFKRLSVPFESQSGTRQETYKTGGKLDTWTEAFDSTFSRVRTSIVQQSTQNGATGVLGTASIYLETLSDAGYVFDEVKSTPIIAQGSREVGDNSVGSLTKLLQTSNNALGTSKMEFVNSKPGSLLSIEIPSLFTGTSSTTLPISVNGTFADTAGNIVPVALQKEVTANSYTVLPTDVSYTIFFNSVSAVTVTLNTGLPANFECSFYNLGAGTVTFVSWNRNTDYARRYSVTH
jgi:hypothetical protein